MGGRRGNSDDGDEEIIISGAMGSAGKEKRWGKIGWYWSMRGNR